MTAMQRGVFSIGYPDQDPPMTGRVVRENQAIQDTLLLAQHAEEVGLDVFAFGEHHNPPFWSSSPPATLAYLAAKTTSLRLTTSTTLITTNDPVKLAEEYAVLQHLSAGRVDLMLGRGNTGPVYPWFGKDIRDGIDLAIENLPGRPVKVAREQLDALAEVVPILRSELDRGRPAEVAAVPTHASRRAARDATSARSEAA